MSSDLLSIQLGVLMKLYIVSDNADIYARWKRLAKDNEAQRISIENIFSAKLEMNSCALVHLDELTAEKTHDLCGYFPHVKFVGLSDHPEDNEGLSVLLAGFKGYINTFVTASIFNEMIKAVTRNDIWAGPSITQILLKQFIKQNLEQQVSTVQGRGENSPQDYGLTPREDSVLRMLLQGASNKEIANELGITERTVKAHVSSILNKVEVKDRRALIIKLSQNGA